MESETEKWHRIIVKEKSSHLSDFLIHKRSLLLSDNQEERESTVDNVLDVLKTLPDEFLQEEEVQLLLDYFLSSLDCSPLAGGSVIRVIHHIVFNSKKIPRNIEARIVRVLFQEGSLQSWAQKERQLQYEILNWTLQHRVHALKAMGYDFISMFIKSVSGERDPRCLVHMFSAFLKITNNFTLGVYTEDMFETIACYFPIEFRPKPEDGISREFLATSCASCLVSSSTFAPFCFLFIDEKLNDEECTEEEYHDVLDLLTLACDSFPRHRLHEAHQRSLIDGIRKIALNPNNKGELPGNVLDSFRSIVTFCEKSISRNEQEMGRIVNSILENSEPFVLQAEMGLCKKGLSLLLCAFENLNTKHAQIVFNQAIAWIITLVQGDSINVAANKVDIIGEGLDYLVEWIKLGADLGKNAVELLSNFERTIFDSCLLAREFKPQAALVAIYECAMTYMEIGCVSDELVSMCRSFTAQGLKSVEDEKEFRCFLRFVSIFSSYHFDEVKNVIADNPIDTWTRSKVLAVLCAISYTENGWSLAKQSISEKLENGMKKNQKDLEYYVKMMTDSRNANYHIFLEQFDVFDTALLKANPLDGIVAPKALQQITLLLNSECHQFFMNKLTSRYRNTPEDEVLQFDEKYRLVYLQNSNTTDLLEVREIKQLSDRTLNQLLFAACNRTKAILKISDEHRVVEVKACLLKNSKQALSMFEDFLTQILSKQSNDQGVIEYLLDFDSCDTNPDTCLYLSGSTLWRQRIFVQVIPIYKKKFEEAGDKKYLMAEMLPHLLKFAETLNPRILKKEYAMMLPILIELINSCSHISLYVVRSIPMFLSIKEPLQSNEVRIIVQYLCLVVKQDNCEMDNLENALHGLDILARHQSARLLLPEMANVIASLNKTLGHKKRLLRVTSANVKNNWEILITK
ncbi:unnamed protein product [Caenorhabditis sp. 36 PRJEB53466]|nr:unnamed protein product [Caenorhabditis sp. 36 PRJEB53466]